MSKPDYQRIQALEAELLGEQPKPVGEFSGYLVLVDSTEREASDRVPVSFSFSIVSAGRLELKINGGPVTLIPTRWGSLRAVAVFGENDANQMPVCTPDVLRVLRPGDTFVVTPY